MKYSGSMSALMAAGLLAGPVFAQQAPVPSPAVTTERDAGNAALIKAEKLLNDNERRGPNSEACALMNKALLHYVKAAVEAGAKTRELNWSQLTLDEQAAVKGKIDVPFDRNNKLRIHACAGAS
jgi:hypothetical protein